MKVATQNRRRSNQNLKNVAFENEEVLPEIPIEVTRRVLAVSLGVDKCAYSIVQLSVVKRFIRRSGFFKVSKHNFKLLHTGFFKHTISDFIKLNEQTWAFTQELVALTEKYSIDALAVERYQK